MKNLGRKFRRLQDDLDAGLIFGWRVPGGSFGRTVAGVLVATALFAGGASLLRVEVPVSAMPARQAAQVIVLREGDPESWELLDWARFHSPFPDRWVPRGTGLLEDAMVNVTSDLAASCAYTPHLMPHLESSGTRPLPGLIEVEFFPLPAVGVNAKLQPKGGAVANVGAVSEARGALKERWGTEEILWGGKDRANLVGAEVRYTVAVTPEGRVAFCLELAGGGDEVEVEVNDAIKAWLRGHQLEADPAALGMTTDVVVVRFKPAEPVPAVPIPAPVAPIPDPEEAP